MLFAMRQVSEKERKLQYDTLFKDIASVLVAKCVNSETNRPYTISMLERSLKEIHFAVDPKRGAKQQALEVPSLPLIDPTSATQRVGPHVRKRSVSYKPFYLDTSPSLRCGSGPPAKGLSSMFSR